MVCVLVCVRGVLVCERCVWYECWCVWLFALWVWYLAPDEKVEDEEDEGHEPGVEEGGEESGRLPLGAAYGLVRVRGVVASGHAHDDEEQEHGSQQPAAVGGGEEAEHGAKDADDGAEEQLHTRAERGDEQNGVGGRAEDVSVDEFPSTLFGKVLLVLLIVAVEVSAQRAHHNHCDDAREQQHDRERVDDREPVDLVVAHVEVEVPPRRPADVRVLPLDVVRIDNLLVGRRSGLKGDGLRRQIGANGHGEEVELSDLRREGALVLVLDLASKR